MKTYRTPLRPSRAHVELIRRLAERVKPDPAWTAFLTTHPKAIERRALQHWYAERFVPKGARVLDVGCLPPINLLAMRESGIDAEGVDLNPQRFSQANSREGLTVKKCNIETERLPYDDGGFDAVVFTEVLEHLRIDIPFTLREMHRVLKPGGRLLLSTPNGLALNRLVHIVLQRRIGVPISVAFRELETHGQMGHMREYTRREICDFLPTVGFKVEAVSYRERFFHPLYDLIVGAIPSLRPSVTVVAVK